MTTAVPPCQLSGPATFADAVDAELSKVKGRLVAIHQEAVHRVRNQVNTTWLLNQLSLDPKLTVCDCDEYAEMEFAKFNLDVTSPRMDTPQSEHTAAKEFPMLQVSSHKLSWSTDHQDAAALAFTIPVNGDSLTANQQSLAKRSDVSELEQPKSNRASSTHSQSGKVSLPVSDVESEFQTERRSLSIKIHCAYNLRDADTMIGQGMSDPYCICRVKDKPEMEFRTEVITNSLNPVWNYTGHLVFDGYSEDDAEIEFVVLDSDFQKEDDLLGIACIPVDECKEGFTGCLRLVQSGEMRSSIKVSVEVVKDDSRRMMKLVERSKLKWPWPYGEGDENGNFSAVPRRKSNYSKAGMAFSKANLSRCDSWSMKNGPRTGTQMRGRGWLDSLVSKPNTSRRVVWDMLCLSAVFYDAITVPVIFGFNDARFMDDKIVFYMNLLITVFWSLDIVSTFLTGYVANGIVELRFRAIARRYLKSWFPVDIIIVVVDWLFIFVAIYSDYASASASKPARIVKLSRFVRACKMITILRLAKLKKYWRPGHSKAMKQGVDIVRAVFGIFYSIHLAACAWYALGCADGEATTWVTEKNVRQRNFVYSYVISFEWALAQVTPSPVDVFATNFRERLFKVTVDFGGLVMFSTFIGTITCRLTQLRVMRNEAVETETNVQRYFNEHKVPIDLGKRVFRALRESYHESASSRLTERDIPRLKLLPDSLLQEMRIEVGMPYIICHPFFDHLRDVDPECIYAVIENAVEHRTYLREEPVFLRGAFASGMYIISYGEIEYFKALSSDYLGEGSWLCEASLWIEGWRHRGEARAFKTSEAVCIDASRFTHILTVRMRIDTRNGGDCFKFFAGYAAMFVRSDCLDCKEEIRNSDLWGTAEVVELAAQKARRSAGFALDQATKNVSMTRYVSDRRISWGQMDSVQKKVLEY